MTSASVKLLRTQSDERLAALAAAGHERAFEAIVERHRRALLRHCRRYLPEARAEDALQQALVSAWTALRRGDDVRELRPWLHRIVHNTSLNALRAAGYDYEQLRDTLEGDGGPAELAERSAVVRQALAGLAALPERQREALLQIAVEGRSQDEVADELGVSHNAVRQLVHRARARLRAAATALTPLPLASWLASGGGGARGDLVARIAELAAGAGGGATLAKAGAVATLAGGAIGAPVVVDEIADRSSAPDRPAAIAAPARAERARPAERAPERAAAAPLVLDAAAQEDAGAGARASAGAADRSGRRGARRRDAERSRRAGPGPGGGGGGERGAQHGSGPADRGGAHALAVDEADEERSRPSDDDGGHSRGGGGADDDRRYRAGDADERAVPVRPDDAPEAADDDEELEPQQPAGAGSPGAGSSASGFSGSPGSGPPGGASSGTGPSSMIAPAEQAAAGGDGDSDD